MFPPASFPSPLADSLPHSAFVQIYPKRGGLPGFPRLLLTLPSPLSAHSPRPSLSLPPPSTSLHRPFIIFTPATAASRLFPQTTRRRHDAADGSGATEGTLRRSRSRAVDSVVYTEIGAGKGGPAPPTSALVASTAMCVSPVHDAVRIRVFVICVFTTHTQFVIPVGIFPQKSARAESAERSARILASLCVCTLKAFGNGIFL